MVYTEKTEYTVIYWFHVLEENSSPNIVKKTGYGIAYVNLALDRYFKSNDDYCQMAKQSKDLQSFINMNLG